MTREETNKMLKQKFTQMLKNNNDDIFVSEEEVSETNDIETVSLSKIKAKKLSEDFKTFNFKGMFESASLILKENNNHEILAPFFKLVGKNSLQKISDANKMSEFLNELHKFLNNESFNFQERGSFLNGEEDFCLAYAINAGNYACAENINRFRKNKHLSQFRTFIANRTKEKNYEAINKILELSDSVVFNSSEVIRIMYGSHCRDYDYLSSLISKYSFDINGLGSVPNNNSQWTFAHAVAEASGTLSSSFFKKFIENYNDTIDFNVQTYNAQTKSKYTLLELITSSDLEVTEKLSRIDTILKNCTLSEKHIAFVTQILFAESTTPVTYYDHPIYETLFAHEKFNSNLFDREALLNKLMMLDSSKIFRQARESSNYIVNPTSVLLDKFFKIAKPAIPLERHPFVTWLNMNSMNSTFSRDTLNSLLICYKDKLEELNLHKINVSPELKKAFKNGGVVYPEKKSWLSAFFSKNEEKVKPNKENKQLDEKKLEQSDKIPFNEILINQIKDSEIKKYVDSIQLNYEQFNMLLEGNSGYENDHYINNLLPKFLNKTVENYLHFATIDEEEAKDNVIVQLKLLNKKTFEILTQGLESEKEKIATKGNINKKIIKGY